MTSDPRLLVFAAVLLTAAVASGWALALAVLSAFALGAWRATR